MINKFRYLKTLIEDYEQLKSEAEQMSYDWYEGNDECAAAMADPGLQYEKGCEIETKLTEIEDLMKDIIKDINN